MDGRGVIDWIAYILVVIGAINWGLSVINVNLVETLLGIGTPAAKVVYSLVGLSGLWVLFKLFVD